MGPVDPCDDTVILRVIARLQAESAFTHKGQHAVASVIEDSETEEHAWRVLLAVQREGKQFYYTVNVNTFGIAGDRPDGRFMWALVRIGHDVWEISPSIIIPGQLHAYITLIDVPSPAPWET